MTRHVVRQIRDDIVDKRVGRLLVDVLVHVVGQLVWRLLKLQRGQVELLVLVCSARRIQKVVDNDLVRQFAISVIASMVLGAEVALLDEPVVDGLLVRHARLEQQAVRLVARVDHDVLPLLEGHPLVLQRCAVSEVDLGPSMSQSAP